MTPPRIVGCLIVAAACRGSYQACPAAEELPVNTWVQVAKDPIGARRGCAVRYAPAAGAFFLWGFMDADPDYLQESVALQPPEHDMVTFDCEKGARHHLCEAPSGPFRQMVPGTFLGQRWRNCLPQPWAEEWGKKLPPVFVPRTYSGLTAGSERSLFRLPAGYPAEAARPDVNIVFDQVAYHPGSRSLVYFTGGLTVAYDVERRRWSNLAPAHLPPPVLGGAMAYDPLNDEMVLFGGGHVAEAGPGGRIVGYTGTWVYSFAGRDWRRLRLDTEPPPRMYSPVVCDTKNQALVLFGGDGQSHYLADTWRYDLRARCWLPSKASGGPPPRAGHFAAYDPQSGWVIVGGGFNRDDLTDMWAYDAGADRWRRLESTVPTGAYITADISPQDRLLLLVSNTRAPGHGRTHDVLYAARTTYACRIDPEKIVRPDDQPQAQESMPKRPAGESGRDAKPDPERQKAQEERLRTLPVNRWILLDRPGRTAPVRTWGSAAFDSDRGRILLWGGGHCGYGGSDVDLYDVAAHTWLSSVEAPEYPHRLWAGGVRLAGVTFGGNPWTEHARRVHAYDPVSRRMIMVRPVLLTTGYEPEVLHGFPGEPRAHQDAKVVPPTSYSKFVTWTFDLDSGRWDIVGPAPLGLDTLLSTPRGVLGVNVDWRTRLDDAGYLLPWDAGQPQKDNAVYRFEPDRRAWKRLGGPQPSPQNLYELTTLGYDAKRDRMLLHGGGQRRDELWAFDLRTERWQNLAPRVVAPPGAAPPACNREGVYLPAQDVFITYGPGPGKERAPALWAYRGAENAWRRIELAAPPGVGPAPAAGQNRALLYDAARDLVLMVLGASDRGDALVYALRYRDDQAQQWHAE